MAEKYTFLKPTNNAVGSLTNHSFIHSLNVHTAHLDDVFSSHPLGNGPKGTCESWMCKGTTPPSVALLVLFILVFILFAGLTSLAASYLNPVKSLVPQMPKLLKSLFPVRDEKKSRHLSPLTQQVRKPHCLWGSRGRGRESVTLKMNS